MFPVVMSTGGAPDYSVGREAAGVKSLAICTTVPARGGLCCPCANGAPSAPKREALAGGGPRASPPPAPAPAPGVPVPCPCSHEWPGGAVPLQGPREVSLASRPPGTLAGV